MLKLILAGILAIPCILVAVATAPILAIFSIPSLLLLLYRKDENGTIASSSSSSTTTTTTNVAPCDHVIIFGGSSGIGLAIAKECARKKNSLKITILARNEKKLDDARAKINKEVSSTGTTTKVEAISVSVSDYDALEKIAEQIAKKEDRTIIFNCAGISYTTEYDQIPIEVYEKLVQTNLIGSMYVARAFLPHMVNGCLVLCSSAAGQVGMYGYTAYSPTKFALRGFAEALHAELIRDKPGVSIQWAFPVDTDTPGYKEETKMMPEITKILNATAGLARPEE
jgi:3-dehydrosphinganine reductase